MIKISIIEDNKYMREGWQAVLDLDSNICVIAMFESCEDAFKSDDLAKTDLILLDIQLPGISGIEGVKTIKQRYPDVVVLMVTMHDDNERVFEALRNGADGYLLKKVTPAELVEAIKIANEGGSPMTPNIARKVIQSFQKTPQNDVDLTAVEKLILKGLANGLSYKALAEEIHLSIDGVRYHI